MDLLGVKLDKPKEEPKEIARLNIIADRPCINSILKEYQRRRNFALGRITNGYRLREYAKNQAKLLSSGIAE